MPCLFRPFLLEKIFSSNFPCKGKDSICFGFPAGAQESLALVLDELTQLVMGDVLVHCGLFPSFLAGVALPRSAAVLPQVWILLWGGG